MKGYFIYIEFMIYLTRIDHLDVHRIQELAKFLVDINNFFISSTHLLIKIICLCSYKYVNVSSKRPKKVKIGLKGQLECVFRTQSKVHGHCKFPCKAFLPI